MEDNQHIDFWLLAITLILAGIGLVMVYSSSMNHSMDKVGTASFYFKKQSIHLVIGFMIMMLLTKVNYRGFANIGTALLIIGYGLLCALLFQKFLIQKIMNDGDVNRWLQIGKIAFQPSEIMKIMLIIFLAGSISKKGEKIRDFDKGFLPLICVIIVTFGLVVIQPDLGAAT